MAKIAPIIRLEEDVLTLAKQRLVTIFERFDHIYCSFSGGKDSCVTLLLALEVLAEHPEFSRHLPLRTVFFDEEAIPYETEEYVARVAARPDVDLEWYCLPVQHRNACSRRSPYWWPWAPEAEALWCRPLPAGAITTLPGWPEVPEKRLSIPTLNPLLAGPEKGNVCILMGIRAAESLVRSRALRLGKSNSENYIIHFEPEVAGGTYFWKGYPIYDWLTADVWTAIQQRGWDYNRAYDRMEMAGLTHASQRCSPAFGEEPIQKLYSYAQCFPEVWEKMVERVPGVGAAYRYALTELWNYHGAPTKPADMDWPDFINHYIAKFRPEDQEMIAARVREEIRRHYRKTSHPILHKAVHPLSGVSWNFLLQLAMRGDFKGRKQPSAVHYDEEKRPLPRFWQAYATELSAAIADGTWPDLAYTGRVPRDPWRLVPAYAQPEMAEVG